jgi:hypothetical protein
VSDPQRFRIPSDPASADQLASELGELATATEWKRAALVYSRVRVQEGQGRPTSEKAKFGLLSPAEYALLGVHGLRSRTTIRAYWRAWDNAITEGLARPVKLGDEVELPDAQWEDYYHITPDCPPWANTAAPSRPVEEMPWREPGRSRWRDLPLGDCPPAASDVDEPPGSRRHRELISDNAIAAKTVDLHLRSLESRVATALRTVKGITDWDGNGEAVLTRIERIRQLLNDIEQTVRREADQADDA